jgi:hypothetical protein
MHNKRFENTAKDLLRTHGKGLATPAVSPLPEPRPNKIYKSICCQSIVNPLINLQKNRQLFCRIAGFMQIANKIDKTLFILATQALQGD